MERSSDEQESPLEVVDRFEGGMSWIAHPDERMERASHALVVDEEVWVVDPVDAVGLDDLLADLGPVAGVVVLLDRHIRDAEALADRHASFVYLPEAFSGEAGDIDAPIVRFEDELGETGIEAITVVDNRFWHEVALYDRGGGTLVIPEAVGTAAYFRAGSERLGVHPLLRVRPPRQALGSLRPERVLVGHGRGVTTDAARALHDSLRGSRRRTPRLLAGYVRRALPI